MSKSSKTSPLLLSIDNKTKSTNNRNQAIISTAFQDHISKQLQLNHSLDLNLSSFNNLSLKSNKSLSFSKHEVKSKVNTGLSIKKKCPSLNKNDEEKEYVISKPNEIDNQTSLAEKFGLVYVDKSRRVLNEEDWSEIKEKYRQREDYKDACVICKESLGIQQQVLLSCTHTFHRKCLEVFEKFSGKKCCPMCRKDKYQTRVIHDASKHYKNVCAARIQATWKGYVLTDLTSKIVTSYNFETDNFLNDIDRNIELSRQTFKHFDEKLKVITDDKWADLLNKALERDNDECSICMIKYDVNEEFDKNKLTIASTVNKENCKSKIRPIVLLSCSHIFHHVCLQTFEELNFDKIPLCPECRSCYKKCELTLSC